MTDTHDQMNTPTLFLLNVLMALILAVNYFGASMLIGFGLLATAIILPLLVLVFLDGAIGLDKALNKLTGKDHD